MDQKHDPDEIRAGKGDSASLTGNILEQNLKMVIDELFGHRAGKDLLHELLVAQLFLNVQNVTLQHAQNAVENANMATKNLLTHTKNADNLYLTHAGAQEDALINPVEQAASDAVVLNTQNSTAEVLKALGNALVAISGNMATGRPPVNTPGA